MEEESGFVSQEDLQKLIAARRARQSKRKTEVRNYKVINQDAMKSLAGIVGTSGHRQDIRRISKAQSLQGANEWIAKNKKKNWEAKEEDIDRDGISDVLVKDANGNLVIVNGYSLTPSKYPYRKLYQEADPEVRADYKNYRDYIKDVYIYPVYDDTRMNIQSFGAAEDKLELMKTCDEKFAKVKPKNRTPYQAFISNYIGPLFKHVVRERNLYSKWGKKPAIFMDVLKYSWNNWVIVPVIRSIVGDDQVEEVMGNEEALKTIKATKQFKYLLRNLVITYFNADDAEISDMFSDISDKIIELSEQYFESKGIEVCAEYGTENPNVGPFITPIDRVSD